MNSISKLLLCLTAVAVIGGTISAVPLPLDPPQTFKLQPKPLTSKPAVSKELSQAKPKETAEVGSRRELRRNLAAATREARKKGDISARDARRIRVMSFSPAFIENVEDLAIAQIASSGVQSDSVPIDAEGKIIRTSVNWSNLLTFLEALLPLILELINAFG